VADKHQVRLQKRITTLSNAITRLAKVDDLRELLLLIRRPGWTTPAEFAFAAGIADALIAQVEVVGRLKTALLRGSGEVGTSNPMPGRVAGSGPSRKA
jgi:hypothetical protein